MKQNSLVIPLVGGGFSLLCFFMPWVKFDSSSLGLSDSAAKGVWALTFSGFSLATGGNFITLAFIATLAIIGISIYMLNQKTPWKARILVLISSGVGFLCLLFILPQYTLAFNPAMRAALDIGGTTGVEMQAKLEKLISLQFGGFGAAIGFIVALIGAWSLPKSDPSIENSE